MAENEEQKSKLLNEILQDVNVAPTLYNYSLN